jgi:hypothetical protein
MGHKRRGRVEKEIRAMNAAGRQCDRAQLTDEQQLRVLKDCRPGLSRKEVLKLRERMKILVGPLHG